MTVTDSSEAYSLPAIVLHWLLGLAIVSTFGLGLFMTGLPLSPDKLRYYSWHKWTGVTIFLLTALRLGWRLAHPAPAAPLTMPAWQRMSAAWTHRLLYVLMFCVPISGWLMSSALGVPTVYFGLWQLPDLIARNMVLGGQLQDVHATLNYTMAALVLAHTVAALKHYLIDRDEVLPRMIPVLKTREPRRQ